MRVAGRGSAPPGSASAPVRSGPTVELCASGSAESSGSAPAGQHDDTVMALALAWQAVTAGGVETTRMYFNPTTGELTDDPDAGRVRISPY